VLQGGMRDGATTQHEGRGARHTVERHPRPVSAPANGGDRCVELIVRRRVHPSFTSSGVE
jgi:hypothetical protein